MNEITISREVRQQLEVQQHLTAVALGAIWDYRSAGLKIDEARDYVRMIQRQKRSRTMRRYHQQHPRQAESTPRIIILQQRRDYVRREFAAWITSTVRKVWSCDGRDLLTIDHETGEWQRYTSTKSYYHVTRRWSTTHLLREGWQVAPGTMALLATGGASSQFITLATEQEIEHNKRGNWQERTADALGLSYTPSPVIAYKAVAITDEGYRSIYDGKTTYALGEETRDVARSNHNGGIYVYPTVAAAAAVEVPHQSVLADAPRAILACSVSGRKICYDSGKMAYTSVTPIELVCAG